jgi:hypothetical protein
MRRPLLYAFSPYPDHHAQLPSKASCTIVTSPPLVSREITTPPIRSSCPALETASRRESAPSPYRRIHEGLIMVFSITKFASPPEDTLQSCRMEIRSHPWERLPTIWNIVDGLAGLKLGDVREVACQTIKGAGDVAGVRRLR